MQLHVVFVCNFEGSYYGRAGLYKPYLILL